MGAAGGALYERQQAPLPDVPVAQTPAEVRVKAVERNVETLDFSNAEAAGILEQRTEACSAGIWYTISRNHMTYNAEGWRTSLENLAGQVTTTAWDGWSVTYNGENRPVLWECVSTNSPTPNSSTPTLLSMSYDRMGRRVIKNDQRFVYNGYLQIADNSGNAYIWDPTAPVVTRPLVWLHGISLAYHSHDGNKNVSEVIASHGEIAAHYEYAPFGAIIVWHGESASKNPWRFSSEFAEDDTATVCYNYRHYEPVVGRWLVRDLIDERGGLNLYATCYNNLMGRSDVHGLLFGVNLYDLIQFGLGAYAGLSVRNWFNKVRYEYDCCHNGEMIDDLGKYDGAIDETMTSWTIAHRVTGCKLKAFGVDLWHVILLNIGHETLELLGLRPEFKSEFMEFYRESGNDLKRAVLEYFGDTAKDILAVLEGYFSDGKDCEDRYIPAECVKKGVSR